MGFLTERRCSGIAAMPSVIIIKPQGRTSQHTPSASTVSIDAAQWQGDSAAIVPATHLREITVLQTWSSGGHYATLTFSIPRSLVHGNGRAAAAMRRGISGRVRAQ
jgi:hypothetical protein